MKNYKMAVMVIILLSLVTLNTSCGAAKNELKAEEVVLKEQEFYQIVDCLNDELQDKASSEEYFIVNGKGKKLVPSEVLDYQELIETMNALEPYCYFTLLDSFLAQCGYKPGDFVEAHTLFFSLSDKDKAKVLSCMFRSLGETAVAEDSEGEISVEVYILRAFTLIDKKTRHDIPKNDG